VYCRTEGRRTPLLVVVFLVHDYICKGGAALTYVEVVLDLCGVDSVHDLNDEGYTPLDVLMMLVCIQFCHLILMISVILAMIIKHTNTGLNILI